MQDNTSNNKHLLTNVAIIRPFLVVLLVFYHAFAIYGSAWNPIPGFLEIKTYWWLDKLSYAFMLETFVFVSGYVFGYQVRTKGEIKLEARSLFFGKLKRLIMPCMVFSFLYILLLGNIKQPITKTLYDLVNGYGHMWFLPMLFWCFVGVWIIEKLKLRIGHIIAVLIICSIFSFVPLPLQMGSALYFMFFFYMGYFLQRNDIKLKRFYKPIYAATLFISFAIAFPSLTLFRESVKNVIVNGRGDWIDNQMIEKAIALSLSNFTRLIYASIGLTMLFAIVGLLETKRSTPLPKWVIKIGGLCMGVYLFQQFILKGLYLYTALPEIFGPIWLPWIGFVIALTGSLLISYLMRMTKAGRFLIG